MRIGNYVLENNVRLPLHVIEYLQERYEALENYLENKYGDQFDISMDYSRQSESAYLTISEKWEPNKGFCNSVEISFRNHDNFANSQYDKAVFLSKYETWTECKKDFLNNILPDILNQLGDESC